jgi:Ni/Co efflux regulator RcnB
VESHGTPCVLCPETILWGIHKGHLWIVGFLQPAVPKGKHLQNRVNHIVEQLLDTSTKPDRSRLCHCRRGGSRSRHLAKGARLELWNEGEPVTLKKRRHGQKRPDVELSRLRSPRSFGCWTKSTSPSLGTLKPSDLSPSFSRFSSPG